MDLRGTVRRLVAAPAVVGMMMAAIPVLAQQGSDEKPTPPSPQVVAEQERMLAVIALFVAIAVGWYLFRRWQIIRASSATGASAPRSQD